MRHVPADRRLRRRLARVALLIYAHALLVGPVLHARHHAAHGQDHRHGAAGTVALAEPHDASADDEDSHHAFHEAIDLLSLAEVATAGTLEVDCSLSPYTLVDCVEGTHAPHFGDALIAHGHRPERRLDPRHGQGALEHLQAALVTPTPILLPPPELRTSAPPLLLTEAQRVVSAPRTQAARGPPSSLS